MRGGRPGHVALQDRAPPAYVRDGLLLLVPLAGLALLLAVPRLDGMWQHNPSHFWLVLVAATISAALAYATGTAASRRGDPRVFLVSLTFLSSSGFLALHALATPRVLLEGSNAGFVSATPVGLAIGGAFAALSSLNMDAEFGRVVARRANVLRGGVFVLFGLWAAVSLTRTWPLDGPPLENRSAGLLAIAFVGIALYATAIVRYGLFVRDRSSRLVAAMVAAFILLAEAMVAIAAARTWHASWWEWHVLMLVAFLLIAHAAQREWHEERFADLYVDAGDGREIELTVLFADLAGFTAFSERHDPRDVAELLNTYFQVAIPRVVAEHRGRIDRIIGDALMATFRAERGRDDHAIRAARAAASVQRAVARVVAEHPDWPRMRIGVNTGVAVETILGTSGGRTATVIGDVVNTAQRLESSAPIGGVALGAPSARRLPPGWATPAGPIRVKGKHEPVEVFHLAEGVDLGTG